MRKSFSLTVFLALSISAFAQNTATFRGNLEHTGVYNGKAIHALKGVKWKFATGGPVISSPAIVGDTLYVGSVDKNLYALGSSDGSLKWKFATESAVTASPAVADGFVYFGSHDGNFYALEAATGTLKWKFKTGGERRYAGTHLHGLQPAAESMPDPWDFFLSSPAVWSGTVFFGSGDGHIYALDGASGNLKWKFKTGDVVHSSPAIAGGVLYVGSWDSYLYALDAATGKAIWQFKTGDDPEIHNHVGIQSSPAVVDGAVYFGCRDSNVYAVDAKTGKQIWSYSNKGSWVNNSPAVHDGKVYFATSIPSVLHAVDAKTGADLFSLDAKSPVFSSIAVIDDMLYVGAFDGKLTAVDLARKTPAWIFQTEGSKQNFPGISNPDGTINFGAVFAGNFYDDMVVAVHKLLAAGTVLSSPTPAGNVLYVGSADGNVYALE